MKQIELELKKRLLIREFPSIKDLNMAIDAHTSLPDTEIKLICKGSELTKEIASRYVENFCAEMKIPAYRNYSVKPEDLEDDHWAHVANDALESFISAIEAEDYYWGNPIEDKLNCEDCYDDFKKYKPKTFNPEETLIFEIV